ncbi:phage antirepressor KilAC domain-containing protein [Aeromonas hydrophila]|uniref:phage antirepressor KilAC domain-containing protein n=1 Tax=Aeromonas hydrophila TaxID=644 RepID=UPI0021F412BA|nr:phage antirepressor KilAC domain-containing protein [Aeromonas hydrophila]MCV9380462.1 phage antirepressor KilAC domain-containing protein [Aeromonas hydrophila]
MTNLISKAFEGHNIRIITDQQGDPWFVAKDVAIALGYRDAANMTRNLRVNQKGTLPVSTPSSTQMMTVITETGLYLAVLKSRIESAERFQDWVTDEVLPSIRKHGGYLAGQESDSPELIMAKALMVAQSVIDRKSQELAAAQQTIADNAHKNDFFDNYAYCGGSLGFREVAKLLKAKEHEFRAFLCAKRYMYQLSGQWMAYAQHLDAGRFEVKTGTAERNNYAFAKTVFTPKGVQWIAGEWGKHQAEKELNCQVPALQETPYTYAQH